MRTCAGKGVEPWGAKSELKLVVLPSAIDEIVRLPWLSEISNGAPKCEKLVTVYFDTPKFRLLEHGLAIRIRHIGEKRLHTIKSYKKGARGVFGREEWEEEVKTDTPDLKLVDGTALEPLASKKLQRKLNPIFETVVERTTFPIHSGETDLEVAVDHGFIKAGGRREPISEIEIELKHGDPSGIAMVADRLAQTIPITYSTIQGRARLCAQH
jgi:inorganic triphosphatase YgiF